MNRHPVILVAGALVVGPAPALQIGMDDNERAACQAEGGCFVLTRERMRQELERVRAQALRECKGAT